MTTILSKAWFDDEGQFHVEDEDGVKTIYESFDEYERRNPGDDSIVLAAICSLKTLGADVVEKLREDGVDPTDGLTKEYLEEVPDLLVLLHTVHYLLWQLDPVKYPKPSAEHWEIMYAEVERLALGHRLKESVRQEVAAIEGERAQKRRRPSVRENET